MMACDGVGYEGVNGVAIVVEGAGAVLLAGQPSLLAVYRYCECRISGECLIIST